MAIKNFNIEYECDVFHPGQMVCGRVCLSLDEPTELKDIEVILSGKAKCYWMSRESYANNEGNTEWRDKSHAGGETYFKTKIILAEKEQMYNLPVGDHMYPFSVPLPKSIPATYIGTYGGITFCGKAKLNSPLTTDRTEKKYFIVENPLNINGLPEFNRSFRDEKNKTFCCWCCASGPLKVMVQLPRSAYTNNETIPITIDIDNGSNVRVNSTVIHLHQKLTWKATDDVKYENNILKSLQLGGVAAHESKTWNENFSLDSNRYPNSGHCNILLIKYELEIEVNADGPQPELDVKIPLVIGDIQ